MENQCWQADDSSAPAMGTAQGLVLDPDAAGDSQHIPS